MRTSRLAPVFLGMTLALAVSAVTAHATVLCKDGTRRPGGPGVCSRHGGVDNAASLRMTSSTTNEAPTAAGAQDATGAPPTVSCKDGTQSRGGAGACSRHGGVADAAPNGPSGPASSAPAQEGAGETAGVMCKDGTRSAKSGPGACSDHGGLAVVGVGGGDGSR